MRLHSNHKLFRLRLATHHPLAARALASLHHSRQHTLPRFDSRAIAEAMLDEERLERMLDALDQAN